MDDRMGMIQGGEAMIARRQVSHVGEAVEVPGSGFAVPGSIGAPLDALHHWCRGHHPASQGWEARPV